MILIDLGLVIYDGEKEEIFQETLKSKCEKRKRSVEVTPSSNKKTKSKNIFTPPEIILVDIMAPVELQPDSKQAKTQSATPLGTIDVKFRKYFTKDNTSTSLIDSVASVDNDDDSSTSSTDSDIFTALGNRGEKGESDGENDAIVQQLHQSEEEPDSTPVQVHIYESIKNILGYHILKDSDQKYEKYIDKIGKLVSIILFF